jgi:hypothetical protein
LELRWGGGFAVKKGENSNRNFFGKNFGQETHAKVMYMKGFFRVKWFLGRFWLFRKLQKQAVFYRARIARPWLAKPPAKAAVI